MRSTILILQFAFYNFDSTVCVPQFKFRSLSSKVRDCVCVPPLEIQRLNRLISKLIQPLSRTAVFNQEKTSQLILFANLESIKTSKSLSKIKKL